MEKKTGMHLYIAIRNFNQIILDEEGQTGKVTHALHALDTFFSSIESFGKALSDKIVVEKITGSRLHLYIVDGLLPAFQTVKAVSVYAYRLAQCINNEIPKYKTLKDFIINIGIAFGEFFNFEFTTKEGFSEPTTIGYPANLAAKLQALSGYNMLSIPENIYDELPFSDRDLFQKIEEPSLEKYDQQKFYMVHLPLLTTPAVIDMTAAKSYASSDNLGDIEFTDVRKPLNFTRLNRTQCKKLDGITMFADIRGFTAQFEEDGSNLDEMAEKTQQILETMYQASVNHGGIHIQFQGDRELTLFHNIPKQMINGILEPEQKCFKAAVLTSMRIVDNVKPYSVHVGVGEEFGRLFATKIGAHGEKDNILLGETIITADLMEDKNAGEDQIAITTTVYNGLKSEDSNLASYFKKEGNHYIATIGYQQYLREASYRQQQANTAKQNYNGAWGDEK